MVADGCAIENSRAHADEGFVADGAGVDDGGVADSDVVADDAGIFIGKVEDGVVLNVGVVTDDDTVDVAASDGVVPDAGVVADGDVAENDRASGDVNIFAESRFFVKEGLKLFQEFVHELESNHETLEIHENGETLKRREKRRGVRSRRCEDNTKYSKHENTRFRVFREFRGYQRSSGSDARVEICSKDSYE